MKNQGKNQNSQEFDLQEIYSIYQPFKVPESATKLTQIREYPIAQTQQQFHDSQKQDSYSCTMSYYQMWKQQRRIPQNLLPTKSCPKMGQIQLSQPKRKSIKYDSNLQNSSTKTDKHHSLTSKSSVNKAKSRKPRKVKINTNLFQNPFSNVKVNMNEAEINNFMSKHQKQQYEQLALQIGLKGKKQLGIQYIKQQLKYAKQYLATGQLPEQYRQQLQKILLS